MLPPGPFTFASGGWSDRSKVSNFLIACDGSWLPVLLTARAGSSSERLDEIVNGNDHPVDEAPGVPSVVRIVLLAVCHVVRLSAR